MKFIIFLYATILSINISDAQIKPGSYFVGGDFGGYHVKNVRDGNLISNEKAFTFNPLFGFAIKNNVTVGGQLVLTLRKEQFTLTRTSQHQEMFGAGVFIRQYAPINKTPLFLFFVGRLYGIYSPFTQDSTFSGNKQNTKYHSVTLSAFPGIAYAVSKRIHLESSFINFLYVDFRRTKTQNLGIINSTNIENRFSASTNLDNLANFYIGFRWFISK